MPDDVGNSAWFAGSLIGEYPDDYTGEWQNWQMRHLFELYALSQRDRPTKC